MIFLSEKRLNKYLITSLLLPLIDFLYLTLISSHFKSVVKKITKEDMKFRYTPAILAYVVMTISINYFIIKDIENTTLKTNLVKAFILGLAIYGTFDFTNGAIFYDYDYKTMFIDISWGIILHLLVVFIISRITGVSKK